MLHRNGVSVERRERRPVLDPPPTEEQAFGSELGRVGHAGSVRWGIDDTRPNGRAAAADSLSKDFTRGLSSLFTELETGLGAMASAGDDPVPILREIAALLRSAADSIDEGIQAGGG